VDSAQEANRYRPRATLGLASKMAWSDCIVFATDTEYVLAYAQRHQICCIDGKRLGRPRACRIGVRARSYEIQPAAPPPALQAGNAPHFNGVFYTLDLMLPVVNIGQKYAFNPGGAEQWLSYVLIAAGWTLATTVATGVARVLRRG
jgi:hypothetical protein